MDMTRKRLFTIIFIVAICLVILVLFKTGYIALAASDGKTPTV